MMAQDVHSITATDWQPALGMLGDVVTGIDDITQCIQIILMTPKGSDPHRPTFGCDLWRFIDLPINQAIPHIVREVMDALRLWEPRIQVTRVLPQLAAGTVQNMIVSVTWRIAGKPGTTTTQVTL